MRESVRIVKRKALQQVSCENMITPSLPTSHSPCLKDPFEVLFSDLFYLFPLYLTSD